MRRSNEPKVLLRETSGEFMDLKDPELKDGDWEPRTGVLEKDDRNTFPVRLHV